MSNPLIFSVIAVILIIGAGVTLYITTDIFDTVLGQEKAIKETDNQNNQTNQTVDNPNNTAIVAVNSNLATYESDAGIRFSYPADFQEYSLDELWGLYDPFDNSLDVSFIRPDSCYESLTTIINPETDASYFDQLEESGISMEEYMGEGCEMLDITKKSLDRIELENSILDDESSDQLGDPYSFAGLEGRKVITVDTAEEQTYTQVLVFAIAGDYRITIDLSTEGGDAELAEAVVDAVAQSMKIDQTAITVSDPFSDEDNDQLTYSLELSYDTDPTKSDTDGDGYSDQQEVNNCFNPLGDGKMDAEYFVSYCERDIADQSLISQAMYDNRTALCTAWQPIAVDYIQGQLPNFFAYDSFYNDYAQACATVDSIMSESIGNSKLFKSEGYCERVKGILINMCPNQ